MRKIGEADVRILFVVIIAFFVLFMVFNGFGDKLKQVSFPIKLIPDFNFTSSGGNAMVAIDLTKNEDLQYYNGEKMIKIDSGAGVFRLGDYEFNPNEIKRALENFYFTSERRPTELVIEVNGWRYWEISTSGDIVSKIKRKLVENDRFPSDSSEDINVVSESYFVDYRRVSPTMRRSYSPFKDIELLKNSEDIMSAIGWRDSILNGGVCEKFISLSLMKDGIQETKNYTVRKVDRYLLVDLNDPVYGGAVQKFEDIKSCDFENYVDNGEFSKQGSLLFKFREKGPSFYSKDVDSTIVFNALENNWFYFTSNYVKSRYDSLNGTSFYDGLIILTNLENGLFKEYDANGIDIYVGDTTSRETADFRLDIFEDFDEEVLYDLITKYYSYDYGASQ